MSRRTAAAAPEGLDPYAQIRGVMAGAHEGLHAFVRRVFADAGLDLPITGVPAEIGEGPTVLLLAYQAVMESQAASSPMALVPQGPDADRSSVPDPWRALGKRMSAQLLEAWPKREARGPGLGPLDPLPHLTALPKPIRHWWEERADRWLVDGRARLPFVGWRQAFPLAIRVAGLVPMGTRPGPDAARVALEALGVLAGAVRLGRSFDLEGPPIAATADLHALVAAFAKLDPELAPLAEAARQPRRGPIGLTPHHELGDSDLADVARTLGLPIQPGVVFSIRLSLGGGPELQPGALPHLGPIGVGDR